MRHYYVYLIEEEFANHFFGREAKLFHLFQEYLRTSPEQKEFYHLYKQINYITKEIPAQPIENILKTNLVNRYNYVRDESSHKIVSETKQGNALLHVRDQYIEVTSVGSFDMEAIFFEILRKIDSCFLAMDFESKRYGWLKPIKERKFV
ncbi:sporulation inhibitor of replication protein SirA [Metabacillus idriensis]|uniref:sporulation inhibitor of replication protein SirA n=1 Tax=Metabacillus idriensis TaxID=324768 RepID=UPI00174C87EB|nr:sporulation inhibitor of replication protein SirA [Metabacillus idriensis]